MRSYSLAMIIFSCLLFQDSDYSLSEARAGRPAAPRFRTSRNTSAVATSGIRLAPMRIGSNEYLSAIQPIKKVEMIVPMPAPVPLSPLTDATDALGYRSAGRARAIVDQAA